jgi:hypothetical protein
MKRFLTTGFALVVLLVSNLALADHKDHRDNGRGNGKFEARHNDYRGHDRHRDNRYSRRDHDDDNVSISLHFGTAAPRPFGYNAYGYNMLGYRPEPYRSREPVIIYQNNTYIDPAPSYSGSYRTRRTNRQGVSLLRESSGRCFERYRDGRGNETRTELPASECNF